MNMKETLRTGILEATRLVNAGGLREATAKIQRTLRGILSSDAPADIPSAGADAPIEGTFRVIDAHSPSAGAETNVPPAGASRPTISKSKRPSSRPCCSTTRRSTPCSRK